MTFTLINFEIFLLILVRITGFIFTAPFFSLRNVPITAKAALSISLAAILINTVSFNPLHYDGIINFSFLVISEALAGVVMGFFTNIAYYILNFAGQLLDMEIGFSMMSQLDPVLNIESTITANLYGNLVLLIMLITNLHHYFIRTLVVSFQKIGVGQAVINPAAYQLMIKFIVDYFVIAFRIILPVYAALLVVNTILAILSRIAPQMNMFVIGMQIKIFVGLVVLIMIMGLVPSVADFIFNEMVTMLKASMELLH